MGSTFEYVKSLGVGDQPKKYDSISPLYTADIVGRGREVLMY